MNLLVQLQSRLGMSMLFVSHDLAVVRHVCDRVAVMYLGCLVELAPRDALYSQPRHPYTKALLAAVPEADPTGTACQTADTADWRNPQSRQSALWLPLPYPVPNRRRHCRHEVPIWRHVGDSRVACHLA